MFPNKYARVTTAVPCYVCYSLFLIIASAVLMPAPPPLSSEWWHFNDLPTKEAVGERYTTDPFYLDTCLSELP